MGSARSFSFITVYTEYGLRTPPALIIVRQKCECFTAYGASGSADGAGSRKPVLGISNINMRPTHYIRAWSTTAWPAWRLAYFYAVLSADRQASLRCSVHSPVRSKALLPFTACTFVRSGRHFFSIHYSVVRTYKGCWVYCTHETQRCCNTFVAPKAKPIPVTPHEPQRFANEHRCFASGRVQSSVGILTALFR